MMVGREGRGMILRMLPYLEVGKKEGEVAKKVHKNLQIERRRIISQIPREESVGRRRE